MKLKSKIKGFVKKHEKGLLLFGGILIGVASTVIVKAVNHKGVYDIGIGSTKNNDILIETGERRRIGENLKTKIVIPYDRINELTDLLDEAINECKENRR